MLKISGKARIKHAITGEVYEINEDFINHVEIPFDTGENRMGQKIDHSLTVEHEELGDLSWMITEYPTGWQEGDVDHELNSHTLLEDFKLEIISEDYQKDDHDNY